MSTTKQTTIWCDEQDCVEFILLDGGAPIVREMARREGWVHRSTYDFCPAHSGRTETPPKSSENGS